MLVIDPEKFFRVEYSRRFPDVLHRKFFAELIDGKDFLVPVGPSEPNEIVDHRIREVSQIPVGGDGHGAVSLAQPRFIGAQNHRHMAEEGEIKPQSIVELYLARRVVEMIVSPYYVGNSHGSIIHHNGKVVCGNPVGPNDYEVVKLGIFEDNPSLDLVVDYRLARVGTEKPQHVFASSPGRVIEAAPVIGRFFPFFEKIRPCCIEFLLRAVAPVGFSLFHQVIAIFSIDFKPFRLEIGTFVPGEAQVLHAIENCFYRLLI